MARDLALLGIGDWGKNLARCFDALGALAAVVDPGSSPAARDELRARHPAVSFRESVAEVLADPSITRVAIATPAATHFALAEAALQHGKHLFVEKPLCLEPEQAQRLVELAEARGSTLMVGHLLQYHPCIAALRELVAQGGLGRILTITSSRLSLGKFRKEENALWSFAPHDISVILSLLGNQLPSSVRCMGGSYLTSHVADSTLTFMRFADSVMAQIHVSWLSPFKEQKLTVVGTEAMAVFDDTKPWPEKLLLFRDYLGSNAKHGAATPLYPPAQPVQVAEAEPLAVECAHFLEACAGRTAVRTDGAEAVRVLTVLDMAQRSLNGDGEAVRPVVPSPPPESAFVHPNAVVESGAEIGAGSRVWQHAHVMSGARVGQRCVLGKNVSIAGRAIIGDDVRIQNNVSVYDGVVLEDFVFLGPSCVLTNVRSPRAEISRREQFERTLLKRGATVGANATIVCGVTLGRYCFVAAGAVVTRDVPDYALVMGNPARQRGYVSRHGHRLEPDASGLMTCPASGLRYREVEPGVVRCLDLDESAPLPPSMQGR